MTVGREEKGKPGCIRKSPTHLRHLLLRVESQSPPAAVELDRDSTSSERSSEGLSHGEASIEMKSKVKRNIPQLSRG